MTLGSTGQAVDFGWFREQLLTHILPHWLKRAVTPEGLFLPHFDREWRPTGETYGTLVSQGRLLYNFAIGHELTGDASYLGAIEAGARFLLEAFRDRAHGGWLYATDGGGRVVDERRDSYGYDFLLFGLAHAARVTRDPGFVSWVPNLVDWIHTMFGDAHGGLVSRRSRDWHEDLDTRRSQNPVMHCFEALLAASAAEHLPENPLETAECVARFVFPRLLQPDGELPEVFTKEWQDLPEDKGGWICIGHQLEWAFLLSRSVELGLPDRYLDHAETLLQRGMELGYDAEHGGIFTGATPSGEVHSTRKGWWEQCEALRALLHFALVRGRDDLWAPLEQTLAFVKQHLVDEESGGWFASVEADGRPVDTRKGGPFKLDYHQVALCAEALRLAARSNTCH